MKQRILTGWTFQRGLYAAMGILIIGQSIIEKQWIGAPLGIYFASMGIFAFGCAAGNCYVSPFQQITNEKLETSKDLKFNKTITK